MVRIKRSDIVLVNLNRGKGSEQAGVRPCLIIQNDLGNEFSPTTIIAAITSKKYDKEYPTNVRLSKNDSRLDKESTVLLNQIRTIDKKRIIKKICSLDPYVMGKVDLAIKASFGLD